MRAFRVSKCVYFGYQNACIFRSKVQGLFATGPKRFPHHICKFANMVRNPRQHRLPLTLPPLRGRYKPRGYGETDFCAACVAGIFVSGEARFRVGVEQQARRANAMIGFGDAAWHQAKRPIGAFNSASDCCDTPLSWSRVAPNEFEIGLRSAKP